MRESASSPPGILRFHSSHFFVLSGYRTQAGYSLSRSGFASTKASRRFLMRARRSLPQALLSSQHQHLLPSPCQWQGLSIRLSGIRPSQLLCVNSSLFPASRTTALLASIARQTRCPLYVSASDFRLVRGYPASILPCPAMAAVPFRAHHLRDDLPRDGLSSALGSCYI